MRFRHSVTLDASSTVTMFVSHRIQHGRHIVLKQLALYQSVPLMFWVVRKFQVIEEFQQSFMLEFSGR